MQVETKGQEQLSYLCIQHIGALSLIYLASLHLHRFIKTAGKPQHIPPGNLSIEAMHQSLSSHLLSHHFKAKACI